MDIVTIFSIVLLSLVLLIFVTNIIRGLRRGLKKSLVSLCFLAGIFVILLIFSGLITKGVSSINVGFLNITIEGTKINYLSDIGTILASMYNIENGAVLGELLLSLPLMVINVLVFTLLFFVLRLILWPIYVIVCALVTKRERTQKKEWKNAGKPNKPIKNGEVMPEKPNIKRGWGALIGVACAIIVCFVVLIPITGLNSYVQDIGNIQISNALADKITSEDTPPELASSLSDNVLYSEDEKVSLFELLLEPEHIEYVNIYENSIIGKAFNVIGLNKLGALTFDGLTRTSVNGETISLKQEIVNITEVYAHLETLLVDYDLLNTTWDTLKTFTQEDYSNIISTSRKVLGKAFDSKIVSVLLNNYFGDIVKFATDDLVENTVETEVQSLILREIINTSIDYLVEVGDNHEVSKFIYKETDKVLGLAQTFNNYNLLVAFINNNYNNIIPENFNQNKTIHNNLLKDFDVFVDYMNTLDSEIYEKGDYIHSLSSELSTFLSSSGLFGDLLPVIQENAIRNAYKEVMGEIKYNEIFTPNYLLEEGYLPAQVNIDSCINRLKSMNSQLFTSIFECILNGIYNYEGIEEIINLFSEEDGLENAINKLNNNTNIKSLIAKLGGLVDIVTSSQVMPQNVQEEFIDKGAQEIEKAIKESFDYVNLNENDINKKLCDSILNIINTFKEKVTVSKCEEIMGTIVDSFIKVFDAVKEISNITQINPEEIEIQDITNILQDITSDTDGTDALITNQDIANIIGTVLEDLAKNENLTNPLLSGTIGEDENQKTITEIITNNIGNNNVDWTKEGEVIEEIAQKAIELTQKEDDVDALVEEVNNLLEDLYTTDEGGNKVSKSNIITPELIEYFKKYLNTNY